MTDKKSYIMQLSQSHKKSRKRKKSHKSKKD